jgi:hypothetical protein
MTAFSSTFRQSSETGLSRFRTVTEWIPVLLPFAALLLRPWMTKPQRPLRLPVDDEGELVSFLNIAIYLPSAAALSEQD